MLVCDTVSLRLQSADKTTRDLSESVNRRRATSVMDKEQSSGDVQILAEDSLEFKLLMAYTRKRRPTDSRLQNKVEKTSTPDDNVERNRKKKKSLNKRFSWFVKCIKPKTDESRQPASCSDAEAVENMANELTEISNSVHFSSCEIEPDCPDENSPDPLIQTIVDLLKEQGDLLNEKIIADKALYESLQSLLKYSFYKTVMDTFCRTATSELPPQEETEKTQVALICEATSKLFSVDQHPMRRVLGFGAKYLQDNFPMWISRNMDNTEDEEDEEDEEVQ